MDIASLQTAAGVVALTTSVAAYIPNTRAILAGTNRQKLSSWIIWTGTSLLLFFSCRKLDIPLWVPVAYLIGNSVTLAALAFRRVPALWDLADTLSMGVSLFCMVPWLFFDAPLVTTTALLLMNAAGAVPTLKKVVRHPETENRWAWLLWGLGYIFNLAAVDELSYTKLVYPVIMLIACGSISVLVLWPRHGCGTRKVTGTEAGRSLSAGPDTGRE